MKTYKTNTVNHPYTSRRTDMQQHEVVVTDENGEKKHLFDVCKTKDAVAILAITEDANIIMLQNYRYPVGATLYELPAGQIEDGQIPLEAAKRELAEETGYTAKYWDKIAEFYTSPGLATEKIHLFRASGLVAGEQKLEEMEDLRVLKMGVLQVRELMKTGQIEDAKTLIGLYDYYFLLRE